jgi:type II secretory pathway component GspD/PulD (secretin)
MKKLLIITGISLFLVTVFSFAEDDYVKFEFRGMEKGASGLATDPRTRISLDLRNIDIIEALKFLSLKSGLNIVPTQNVAGRVTLIVENVPVKDVFDIMLRANKLAYDKRSEIYNVMTEAEYRALYGKNFSDTREVKLFRLEYAIPEQAFVLLDVIKSDIGRLLVDRESGTVMMMDTNEKIREAEKALVALEQKSHIQVFDLNYADATEVAEQLKSQLDMKKVGSIKADTRSNQVIVQTLPERMKDIARLIKRLDKKTREVLINTKIIKIKLYDQRDTGIEWEGLFGMIMDAGAAYVGSYPFSAVQAASDAWRSRGQVLKDMGESIGSYPFSGLTTDYDSGTKVSPGERIHVGIVDNKRDIDMVIKYLQTLGKTKILSNPAIAAVDNQEAKLLVGERQAYITTTTTTGATTTTTSEEVIFVEVGIKLSITPRINDEGYVIMKIKPEISSLIGSLTTNSGNVIPIIDTSSAETTIMAKDGSTIILGGLGKEEKTETSEGVPFLSKLPLLGFLFRSSTKRTERSELLIMITPIIFEGDTLVTPDDKEEELHGIKELKKFNVFREEISTGDPPKPSSVDKDKLSPKGFKSYSPEVNKENIAPVKTPLPFIQQSEATDGNDSVHTTLAFKDVIKVNKEEILSNE